MSGVDLFSLQRDREREVKGSIRVGGGGGDGCRAINNRNKNNYTHTHTQGGRARAYNAASNKGTEPTPSRASDLPLPFRPSLTLTPAQSALPFPPPHMTSRRYPDNQPTMAP